MADRTKWQIPSIWLAALIDLIVAIVGGALATIIPEQRAAIIIISASLFTVVAISFLVYAALGTHPIRTFVSNFRRRWNGPDAQALSVWLRLPSMLVGYGFRITCRTCCRWQAMCASGIFTFVAIMAIDVHRTHKGLADGLAISLGQVMYFGIVFFVLYFITVFAVQLTIRLQALKPPAKVATEVLSVLQRYSERADAPRLWQEWARKARQRVDIMACNGSIFTSDFVTLNRILESRVNEPEILHFRFLIANPLSNHLWLRNALMNWRFSEYYCFPFVRLLRWRAELQLADERIEIKMFDGPLRYRMLLTEHVAVVQRYGLMHRGRYERPLLLHAVTRLNGESIPESGSEGAEQSLYGHFKTVFNSAWETRQPVKPLQQWDAEVLKRLARRCRVPKDELEAVGLNCEEITKLIFAHIP